MIDDGKPTDPNKPKPDLAKLIENKDGRPFGRTNVIELADVRLAYGSPAPGPQCKHKSLLYNPSQRHIECRDCHKTLDGFDAFMVVVNSWQPMVDALARDRRKVEKGLSDTLHRRMSKEIDRVWGAHRGVPCPHCGVGLFPEDFGAKGVGSVYRSYEMQRRKFQTNRTQLRVIDEEPTNG